jgi:hypothetical protein
MNSVNNEGAIRALVKTAVESYALGFQSRHEAEVDDPEGTLNMKIHNVFIAALGPEIQYYTALVRSLDSSLGKPVKLGRRGSAVRICPPRPMFSMKYGPS